MSLTSLPSGGPTCYEGMPGIEVWVYWCFTSHATIFQSYMWRHRCAGGLKKKLKLYLRSGSHAISQDSLTCPSYTDPLIAFYDTVGIRRTYSRLKPRIFRSTVQPDNSTPPRRAMDTGKLSDIRVTINRPVSGVDRDLNSSDSAFYHIADRLNQKLCLIRHPFSWPTAWRTL